MFVTLSPLNIFQVLPISIEELPIFFLTFLSYNFIILSYKQSTLSHRNKWNIKRRQREMDLFISVKSENYK